MYCKDNKSLKKVISEFNQELSPTKFELRLGYLPSKKKLQEIAQILKKKKDLKIFIFCFGAVSRLDDLVLITETLKEMTQLKQLEFRVNLNIKMANDIADLLKEKTIHLERISLGGYGNEIKFCHESLGILIQALRINQSLTAVNLNNTVISLGAAKRIVHALKNKSIKEFCLHNNRFNSQEVEALADLLFSFDSLSVIKLNELYFAHDYYNRTIHSEKALQQTILLLRRNNQIHSIVLTLKKFIPSDPSLVDLHLHLQNMPLLESLKLSKFPLKSIDLINKYNKQIKSLYIESCGEKSGPFFSRLITNNSNLEELTIREGLSDSDGEELVKSLEFNNRLLKLRLSLNRLDFKTANALKKSLKSNRALRSLTISNNTMAFKSIQKITEGINKNQTIHELELTGNRTCFAGPVDSLKKNNRLTSIKILNHPDAINPEHQNRDWGYYSNFDNENKISYELHNEIASITNRNLMRLRYFFHQSLLFILRHGVGFPFELRHIIFNLLVHIISSKYEIELLKNAKLPSKAEFLTYPSVRPEERKSNWNSSFFFNNTQKKKDDWRLSEDWLLFLSEIPLIGSLILAIYAFFERCFLVTDRDEELVQSL